MMDAPLQNWHHAPESLAVSPLAPPATPAPIVWMRDTPTYRHPHATPAAEHSAAFRAVATVFAFIATLAIAPGFTLWLAEVIS